jgi:hypothetical protein
LSGKYWVSVDRCEVNASFLIEYKAKESIMEGDEEFGIDMEKFLQELQALSGDEQLRLDVIEKLAQRINLPAQEAELLIKAAIEYLKNRPDFK